MGVSDINKVLTIDDLVHGEDIMFAATAITDGDLLRGVSYFGGGVRTNSLVMRYKTGTVRFVDAIHKLQPAPLMIKR
jgi:fructose-1,6-bisphosphatase II